MAKLILTVGLPGSGKSTWISKQSSEIENLVIVSRDDLIMFYGKGDTYTEKWQTVDQKFIDRKLEESFSDAVRFAEGNNGTVFVDMTNLTAKSRRKWLNRVQGKPNWKTEIHVFQVSETVLFERLYWRGRKEGKFITESIVNEMAARMMLPLRDEADEVVYHNQWS